MKKIAVLLLVVFCISIVFTGCSNTKSGTGDKYPERPINLIVPTAAGGGIDLWNRVLASEMEKVLGQTILVNNMPGGGPGGTGTAYVWNQPHEGYFIVGCSETSLTIPVMTANIDQKVEDWDVYVAGGSPGLLCVNKQSGYKNMAELVAAAKASPDQIKIASSSGGLWLILANLYAKYCDVPLGNATFDGSRSAITACISGETVAVNASLGEVIDFVKSGDLIPVAAYDTQDIEISAIGKTVEAVVKEVPGIGDYLPLKQWIGFMIPNDIPDTVKSKLKTAFDTAMKSEAVKKFAEEQYAEVYNLTGAESQELGLATQQTMCWVLYEMGKTERNPADLKIAKPGN